MKRRTETNRNRRVSHLGGNLLLGMLFSVVFPVAGAQEMPPGGTDKALCSITADSSAARTVFREILFFSPGNGDWIEQPEYTKTGRILRAARQYPEAMIYLTGQADTSGPAAANLRLSRRRAEAVARYLVRKGVAAQRIRTAGEGENPTVPPGEARRVEVRGVIPGASVVHPAHDSIPARSKPVRPHPTDSTGKVPAIPTDSAAVIRNNIPTDGTDHNAIVNGDPAGQHKADAAIQTATPVVVPRYLGVKTNIAAWAGTIMNVAADVQVSKHVSVELPLLWCPWYVSDKHAIKTFTIQPEARYWLSKPGEGHFFGVHAHVGWFNVRWNRDRWQDAGRPLLGAGLSYGYVLPLGGHWAGEFTLGAGYANMRYDTYYNIDNGARIDTCTRNYWGITRVGLSVVYRFNLKN